MSWQAWLTLAVVALTVLALARDWLAPSSTVLGGVIVLLVAGVLTPAQAFSGFSNPAPITVAALYVLARAVEKTGALQPLLGATLGSGSGDRRMLARLLVPVAGASAVLNNTPLVAALAPQVTDWADRRGLSPSRFLMPLSFATILGGVLTLIGTSTNIVVSGLMEADGQAPIGMFELTRIGLPVALVGLAVLIALAPVVLPERRPARGDLRENVREFMVHMVVVPGGPLDGQAVETGGLRHLQGVFLVQVDRGEQSIAPVAPTTALRGGDLLTFVGRADLIVDLQNMRGLASAEEKHMAELDTVRHTFFEAVVGADSQLIGKTLREAEFRSRYQAAVLAIHRSGQRVQAKLGTVRLRVGDTLLLLSDPGFRDRWRDRNDFLLVARFGGSPPAATRKAGIVGLVALGIVVVAGAGLLPTLHASLVGAVLLVASGVMTAGEARSSVDLEVVIVIAAAFGLAAAIERSGLAAHLAGGIVAAASVLGERGVLLGVIVATITITEIITNNAAAVLVFPLAMSAAQTLGADPRPFAMAVAIGASASFLTPIGYQTNMMVYGPGGYRFGDYARLGAPLTALIILTVVSMAPLLWPF
jgi:di/tricarboxylate transporter